MRKINEVILHCSASNIHNYDFDAIRRDHIENRGWSDIGYHFGIDWGGNIKTLRPAHRIGAHTRGRNKNSIGVCILGLDNFYDVQLKSLSSLIKVLRSAYDLPKQCVSAHYMYNKNKTCPNFDLKWFEEKYGL